MNLCNIAILAVAMLDFPTHLPLAAFPVAMFIIYFGWVLEIAVSGEGVTVAEGLVKAQRRVLEVCYILSKGFLFLKHHPNCPT